MLLTPKHLIAVNEHNTFEFMFKYDKLYNDEGMTPFVVEKTYQFTEGAVNHIQYTHDYQELIAQTAQG